jgi:HTH-type transcriptional regulator, competence development regulator
MNQTLGEFIRQTRTQKEMSLRDLARLTGIDRSFLKDIEYDRYSPSEAVLVKLAKSLKVPAKRLRELSVGAGIIAFRKMIEEDRELNVLFIRLMSNLRNGKSRLAGIKDKLSGI